jgi:uncharacterized membrane protein
MLLISEIYLVLTALFLTVASRQIFHNHKFHVDYTLRVTEQEVPVACVTRLTTLING